MRSVDDLISEGVSGRRVFLRADLNVPLDKTTRAITDDGRIRASLPTLQALRGKVGGTARILAVLEPRSNTMKMGVCKDDLAPSLGRADEVFLLQPQNIPWQVAEVAEACVQPAHWSADVDTLAEMVVKTAHPGDHILVMSNGGFGGIHQKLLDKLAQKAAAAE